MRPLVKVFCVVFVLLVFLFSCRKESFTTSRDALLNTSVDTLHFDTVFTTTGSTSQFIKIINNNDKGIRVSSVRLAGGTGSPFKINVDGTPGPQVNDIEVSANDSAYIYVTVTINPNAANLPFIVRDSIEINYNGNRSFVQLDAFGQNAHFYRDRVIKTSETWNDDLPYVILGALVVDTNVKLTINKGCNIHMHADAPFIVHGSLQVNGEKFDSTRVTFSGDRLDEPYSNFPASWPGMIFSSASKDNVLNFAIIKNAYQGIVAGDPSPAGGPKLTLNETIIDNAYAQGIWALATSINARNLLVTNCGQNVLLFGGGEYNFTHCTLGAFSNAYIPHKVAVLTLSDSYVQGGVTFSNSLRANFRNCIFWGEDNGFVPNEVDIIRKGNDFQAAFTKVLWRMKENPSNVVYDAITNQDPQFDSINTNRRFFNFRLRNSSPAVNKGINTIVQIDLDANPRPRPVGKLPDLGAYENQQN